MQRLIPLMVLSVILLSCKRAEVVRPPGLREESKPPVSEAEVSWDIWSGRIMSDSCFTGCSSEYEVRRFQGRLAAYALYSQRNRGLSKKALVFEIPTFSIHFQNLESTAGRDTLRAQLSASTVFGGYGSFKEEEIKAEAEYIERETGLTPEFSVSLGLIQKLQMILSDGKRIELQVPHDPILRNLRPDLFIDLNEEDRRQLKQELELGATPRIEGQFVLGPMIRRTLALKIDAEPFFQELSDIALNLGFDVPFSRESVRGIIRDLILRRYSHSELSARSVMKGFEDTLLDVAFELSTDARGEHGLSDRRYQFLTDRSSPMEFEVTGYSSFQGSPSIPIAVTFLHESTKSVEVLAQNTRILDPDRDTPSPATAYTFLPISESDLIRIEIKEYKEWSSEIPSPLTVSKQQALCRNYYTSCQSGFWRCETREVVRRNCRSFCVEEGWYCEPRWPYSPRLSGLFSSQGCTKYCKRHAEVCDETPLCQLLSPPPLPNLPVRSDLGGFPSPDGRFHFHCSEARGDNCEEKDVYFETYYFTQFEDAVPKNLERADGLRLSLMGSHLLEGARIIFEGGYVCGLSAFEVISRDSVSITIRLNLLHPDSGCRLRTDKGPQLIRGIILEKSLPTRHRCGTLTESSNGDRTYHCQSGSGSESSVRELKSSRNEDLKLKSQGKPFGLTRDTLTPWEALVSIHSISIGGKK